MEKNPAHSGSSTRKALPLQIFWLAIKQLGITFYCFALELRFKCKSCKSRH